MTYSLSTAIDAFQRERAFEVRLRIATDEASILLLRRPDGEQQWLEARPAEGQRERVKPQLEKLGMRRRRFHGGARTMGLELDHDLSQAQLGQHLDRVLNALDMDGGGDCRVEVSCQRECPPDNPKLVEAMRAAASTQDDATRKRLYAALVNATLLVPLDPTCVGRPEHEQEPLVLDSRTFIAFTDWDAMRQWSAHGHPFGLVHGVDFFSHAAEQQAASVRVNPEGVVGGELFAAEVRMMAEAVRGFLKSKG